MANGKSHTERGAAEFLYLLSRFDGVAHKKNLVCISRAEDRARQWARKKGYAKYESPFWLLTSTGREYLRENG